MIEVICREGLHVYKAGDASVHISEHTDGVRITILTKHGVEHSVVLPSSIARTLGYRMVRYANRQLRHLFNPLEEQP